MTRRDKELDRQSQRLLQGARHHNIPPAKMQIITDVLRALADQFQQAHYALLTARHGGWLVTTLSSRNFPEIEKKVVYVYSSYEIAQVEANKITDLDPICLEIGILDMLFQLLALKEVDSLIFIDENQAATQAREISRTDLQKLCEKQLNHSQTYLA